METSTYHAKKKKINQSINRAYTFIQNWWKQINLKFKNHRNEDARLWDWQVQMKKRRKGGITWQIRRLPALRRRLAAMRGDSFGGGGILAEALALGFVALPAHGVVPPSHRPRAAGGCADWCLLVCIQTHNYERGREGGREGEVGRV